MQWILRFRVCVIICLAVVLISAAVIFSVLRAVLPYATGYKNEIQQEISHQIGLPVEIKSIDAAINWFSPRLKLIGVSVYDGKNKIPLLNFKEAFVELDVVASILRREIIVNDIGLIGTDISIEKLSANEWLVQGIKISSEGTSGLPEQFLYMLQNSDYLLHDSNIYYQDHTGEKLFLNLLNVNINVENSFNNHDVIFSMNLPEKFGRELAVVANLSGDIDSLSGEVYVEAQQVNVKQWSKKFQLTDKFQVDSIMDVNLWATLENNDIQELFAQFSANDVTIKNSLTAKRWQTDYLASNIHYVIDEEHWAFSLSDFSFGNKKKSAWGKATALSVSDDSSNYYVSAEFIRLGDAQTIAEVFLDDKQLTEFKTLQSYRLKADIYNLNLKVPKDLSQQQLIDNVSASAVIVDFSMYDSAAGITVKGVDASIQYDDKQAVIEMATQDGEFILKNLLRDPIIVDKIHGSLSAEYDGAMWQLHSDSLQIQNSHLNLFSRLDASFTSLEDIFIDMQSEVYDAKGEYASQYLPVGVMSEGLVGWLDMAVVGGLIPSGKFILHGNLNDFPFTNHNGVFEIIFSAADVELQFLEGWPSLTQASGTIKFLGWSLFVTNASGKTQGASLFNGSAEILNLDNAHLTFSTEAEATNEDIQSYVWNSGLDDILGDSLRLFQVDGTSSLKLKFDVPLDDENVEVVVDGRLDFNDTTVYYSTLGYEISDINGAVDFTEKSIFADVMKAKINNEDITINAFTRENKVGKLKDKPKTEVVFRLDGVIGIDYLLQRYDWIPERWLAGESNWIVDVEVPYEDFDYLVHIKAKSFLKGVGLKVSDVVAKTNNTAVHFSAEVDVLDDNGLRVETIIKKNENAVENIVDLYAVRNSNKFWDFNLASKEVTGKGEFSEGLEKDTKIILDFEEIDIYSLFHTEVSESSNRLNPADIPPLKITAKTVLRDKWIFSDAILETSWHKHGMLINNLSFNGPKMTFDASGTWLTSWRKTHETVLQGTINSSNLGKTLTGLGFEKSIDRAQYDATFDSKWPAEPYGLSWANMKGKTSFEMGKGEIVDVDPGAGGRLLGLLNIFKITNRLVFDFDDVTRDGFAFDSLKGEFEFVNGDGSLKNFDISAAAADINMFGSIGLVEQDYDLLMRLKPHTDTLTFAGGVLLGGVAVGAGLALIQKVFDLGVIGHNVYSITGSWEDPQVEKIVERSIDEDLADDDDF